MKSIIKYSFAIVISLCLSSCEKYGEMIEKPEVRISVSPENPEIGEQVTVTIESDAQYLTIFTGDKSHMFERSRIKAVMENDWESFADTCYKVPLRKEGQVSTWKRYMKDYTSLDQVYQDFEFFGAVDNVELVKYEKDDFPEALIGMSYPGANVLKLDVTDRRIPSGVKFRPGINVMGGQLHEGGNSIIEARFVSCDEDKKVRGYASNFYVDANWGVHTTQLEDFAEHEAGFEYTKIIPRGRFLASLTNDPFGARPTEGFLKIWEMYRSDNNYLKKFLNDGEKLRLDQMDMYFTKDCVQKGGSKFKYDLDGDGIFEFYQVDVDPSTGFPKNKSDYKKYKGFQGTIYLSYFEIGSEEYEPWHTGVSLGSCYEAGGTRTSFTYTYTEAGEYEITVVGANVGNKKHDQVDYDGDRKNSLENYPAKRTAATCKVSVKPHM